MQSDNGKKLVRLSLIFYLPMCAALFFVRPPGEMSITGWESLGLGMAAAFGIGVAVIGYSRYTYRRTAWGRELFGEFQAILAGLNSRQILVLSLLSAFGEEILFRGVIHGHLGLWPTALIFAGFHFPFRRRLIPWTIFAGVLGVVLGGLVEWSETLWPAILLHFMVNYFNIHDLLENPRKPESPVDRVGPGGNE